jgi:hypothetical protein
VKTVNVISLCVTFIDLQTNFPLDVLFNVMSRNSDKCAICYFTVCYIY